MSEALERWLVAVSRRLEHPVERLLGRPGVRAWLHRRAVRAWRADGAPLILCYGNINRSAFAEALARRRRPAARSAGFYPVENRPSPEATVEGASRYGVDLSTHRSRRVTRAELSAANVIFVFDLENLARVLAHSPLALTRTHLLGALGDDPDVLIDDPHGRGEAVLEATLARIARALEPAESRP